MQDASKDKQKQQSKFITKAREIGCDENEAGFDATLNKIGNHKPGTTMAKEQKTAKELKALLDERIARHPIGLEVNPRWSKIVRADPDKEGASWKVSHSSRKFPTGELAKAIEQSVPELQKLYDLKE